MKKIFAVILHYGERNLTLRCIESIVNTKNKFEEIVVVDNNNNFQFSPAMPDNFQKNKVKIIRNKKNLGYAGGINVGIKYALSKKADYVMFLNNDIVFEKEILSKLVKFFEEKRGAGIAAPAIKFIKNGKNIFDLGGILNKAFGKTRHREVNKIKNRNIRKVDYVSGCSMFVKKEVFNKSGFLDENYFLYYEDVDFCIRAKEFGFDTYVLPSISIFHNLSQSVGKNSSTAIYNQTKSALIFSKKNLGFKRFFNFGFILFQSFLFLLKNPRSGIHSFYAFFDYYKNNSLLHILIFILLSFLSYYKVLSFAFWKDDWFGIYQRNPFNAYLLHPGGVIEGFFFLNIFGSNIFFWQLSGIIFRILDSVAIYLMMGKLTKSKFVGFLSGLFFSSTFGALDTVGWASAHITSIAIFFLCLCIYFWLKFYEELKNKDFLLYFILLIFAVAVDPIRVVPIILLLTFLRLAIYKEKKDTKFVKVIQGSFFLFLILVSLYVIWYLNLTGYHSFSLVSKILENPSHILNKIYLIGNYWASLGNLMLGWIINIPEDASTGIYSKFYARLAFVLVPLLILSFILFLKTKNKRYAILSFLVSWIIFFYFPNWVVEPRLTMGGTHRFLNFSAVGFVGLVAYSISFVRFRILFYFFAAFFVVMNVVTSNRILAQESKYRSKETVERIWNKIDKDFPKDEKESIFIYRGEEPMKGNVLALSGSIPLGIKRKIADPYNLPIVTDDLDLIISLLCFNNVTRFQPGKYVLQKSRIPINHIHVWEVKNNGSITNISQIERDRIRKFAGKKCKVLEH